MRTYATVFVRALDTATHENARLVWLEKTPRHLHYISHIERYVSNVRFIHLLRNGPDVIASLYQVTHEHPEAWSGARSIDRCLDRWISDARISLAHKNRPSHKLVTYEELVAQPRAVLTGLCDFIQVHFEDEMLREHAEASAQLVTDDEPWKAGVGGALHSANGTKFRKVFDSGQQQYVLGRLAEVHLDTLTTDLPSTSGGLSDV